MQPAWAHLKKQKYGKILCTSSIAPRDRPSCSPLQSGQSHPSTLASKTLLLTATAALYGQLGFIQTLHKEGSKYNILAAVLAPPSAGGLGQGVQDSETENYVNVVASLIHPSNTTESGHLYEVENGRCSKLRWQRSSGGLLNPGPTMTPAAIIDKWADISDFSRPDYPSTTADLATLLAKSNSMPPSSPRKEVRLTGRVALVTGAGSG